MADDGGVQAKLEGAKKALENAAHSNVSAKASPFAPKPSYKQVQTERKSGASSTSLGDEAKSAAAGLAAKQKNVSDYAASN